MVYVFRPHTKTVFLRRRKLVDFIDMETHVLPEERERVRESGGERVIEKEGE